MHINPEVKQNNQRYSLILSPKYLTMNRGAVKSNIGHLEGSSGIASMIKTILILERALIPPNTNFKHVNPSIDTNALNIEVQDPNFLPEVLCFRLNGFLDSSGAYSLAVSGPTQSFGQFIWC